VVLGVVEDYMVNYGSMEFKIRLSGADQLTISEALGAFVGSYQRSLIDTYQAKLLSSSDRSHQGLVVAAVALLTDFIYETIEKARRRSLLEMLNASTAGDGEALRQRILAYLQTSEFDDKLDAVVAESGVGGLDKLAPLFDLIGTPVEAAGLRGAVGRYLTSYPDVPGLLLLRAVTEALAKDCDESVVIQNAQGAIAFATEMYKISGLIQAHAVSEAVACVAPRKGMDALILRAVLTCPATPRSTVRDLVRVIPVHYASMPATWLINDITKVSANFRLRRGTAA
jgi:ATP-dependent DNA helicase RecQ